DLQADAAIVGPAGQLDRPAPLIAAAVAGLGVAEIRAALVAPLRLRRPPNLLHEPEAAALMAALAHEVRQAQAAIEDAVGAEVDVSREAQFLRDRLLGAHPREQRRQGSRADDAISGHAEASLQSTCVEHGVSSSDCEEQKAPFQRCLWAGRQRVGVGMLS